MHKILANTAFLGKDIVNLTECHSTNDTALSLFRSNMAKEGTIVVADRQTKGKGQRGNKWYSEPGKNLTFSMVLTPLFLDATEQFGLNMAISVGIHDAISEYLQDIKIKWPNDFMHVDRGKLGGLLIENAVSNNGVEMSIAGLGLNVNQTEFPFPNAVSMAILAGAELDKQEIFRSLVTHIEKWYLKLKRGQIKEIRAYYIAHLYRYDEWAWYHDSDLFLGKITGIDNTGNLEVMKQNETRHSYAFKEIRFV
jgi:BirA family biotin operon repressor/biotin-[acetyl-CoA-carboxylase] ligase